MKLDIYYKKGRWIVYSENKRIGEGRGVVLMFDYKQVQENMFYNTVEIHWD